MIRWTLVAFAVLFVIGKLLAMSMQHDASYAHADAVAPLSLAPQCGTCGPVGPAAASSAERSA